MANKICSIDGCEKPAVRRGWCWGHYLRWRSYGSPHYKKKPYFSPETRRKQAEVMREVVNRPEIKAHLRERMIRMNKERAIKRKTEPKYKEQIAHMSKLAYKKKNKIVNDRTFFTSFIKRHCPEIDTSDDIPVTVYRELIEFFHPELMPTLEREWKMYLDD